MLYMIEPIDEYCVQQLEEYDGNKFVCALKEGIEFGESEDEKNTCEDEKKSCGNLCTVIKEHLGDKVDKVVVSEGLSDSPCIPVSGEYDWSANMVRIMKAQVLRDSSLSKYMSYRKIMEIRPGNTTVTELLKRVDADKTEKTVKDLVNILSDTALLTSAYEYTKQQEKEQQEQRQQQ